MTSAPDQPDGARQDPPLSGNERDLLLAFLDYHRNTLRMKVEGLTSEQLNLSHAPSTLTLGGLVKHLALVEGWWFVEVLSGAEPADEFAGIDWDADPDWEFRTAASDSPERLLELLTQAQERTTAAVVAVTDLDHLSVRPDRSGERFSLRWILLHMIEEYARHNGHADLLREAIDGQTGE